MLMGEVDIGIRPSTLHPITQSTVSDCCVYLFILVVFIKLFIVIKDVIVVVTIEDVDLGLKRPATFTFTIVEKVLMMMGEVDVGLSTSSIHSITHVGLLDCWVYPFMAMREAETGLIPSILLHITIMEYTLSNKDTLNKLSKGV